MRIILFSWFMVATLPGLFGQSEVLPLAPPHPQQGQQFQAEALPPSLKLEHRSLRLEFVDEGWQVEDTYEIHNTGEQPYEAHFAIAFRMSPGFLQPPVWIDDQPSDRWRLYLREEVTKRLGSKEPSRQHEGAPDEFESMVRGNIPVQNWLSASGFTGWKYPLPNDPQITLEYGLERTPRGRETLTGVEILTCSVSLPPESRRRLQLRYWLPCDTAIGEIEMMAEIEYFGFAYSALKRSGQSMLPVELRLPKPYQIACTADLQAVGGGADDSIYKGEISAGASLGVVAAHPRMFRFVFLDLGATDNLFGRGGLMFRLAYHHENDYYMLVKDWLRWLVARMESEQQDHEEMERLMTRDEFIPTVKFLFSSDTLTLTAGDQRLTLALNSKQAQWNGQSFALSAPIQRLEGEWYIPLRDAVFFYWRLVGDATLKQQEYYTGETKLKPPRTLDDITITKERRYPIVRVRLRDEPKDEREMRDDEEMFVDP